VIKLSTTFALSSFVFTICCSALPTHQEPDPLEAQDAWTKALSSGDSSQVWAMLGPSARARFQDPKTFDTWCRLYCAELLVEAIAGSPPQLVAQIGSTRLLLTPDGWKIDAAPGVYIARTRVVALQALYASLATLLQSQALSEKEQRRLRNFLSELDSTLTAETPPTDTEHVSLQLGHGTVELTKNGNNWEITSWSLTGD
jgi:hypothetical protein